MILKSFNTFVNEDYTNDEINKMLDNRLAVKNKEHMSNNTRNIEGNIVDIFYEALGDKKLMAYIKNVDDTKLLTMMVKHDPILFNLIYPANNIEDCYYSPIFITDDIILGTSEPKKAENDIKIFNNLSIEKQIQYLTFHGGFFKKQTRKK